MTYCLLQQAFDFSLSKLRAPKTTNFPDFIFIKLEAAQRQITAKCFEILSGKIIMINDDNSINARKSEKLYSMGLIFDVTLMVENIKFYFRLASHGSSFRWDR